MDNQEEKVLNEEEWKHEIKAVISDVKDYVKEISIAEEIPCSNSEIYCNITTFEGEKFCIELTSSGFRIVGHAHGDCSESPDQYFETPYTLLDNISPCYREKFSSSLAAKLQILCDSQEKMASTLEEPNKSE